MSTSGNNYNWANIYVQVPDREALLRITARSKIWIAELRKEIETYYILPRPELRPIFRMRLASSDQETVNRLESYIIDKVVELRNEGLRVEGMAYSTAARPHVPIEVDERLLGLVRKEMPGLRQLSELKCSFLRMLTDFVFQLVGDGTDEEEYKRRARQLFTGNFFCLHLLSVSFCLNPAEEGLASLNYWKYFGLPRIPFAQVPL